MRRIVFAITAALALSVMPVTLVSAKDRGGHGSFGGATSFLGHGDAWRPPGFSNGNKAGWRKEKHSCQNGSVPPGWCKGNKRGWGDGRKPPGWSGATSTTGWSNKDGINRFGDWMVRNGL